MRVRQSRHAACASTCQEPGPHPGVAIRLAERRPRRGLSGLSGIEFLLALLVLGIVVVSGSRLVTTAVLDPLSLAFNEPKTYVGTFFTGISANYGVDRWDLGDTYLGFAPPFDGSPLVAPIVWQFKEMLVPLRVFGQDLNVAEGGTPGRSSASPDSPGVQQSSGTPGGTEASARLFGQAG